MKKLIIVALVLCFLSTLAIAKETTISKTNSKGSDELQYSQKEFKTTFGIGMATFNMGVELKKNEDGKIIAANGIDLGTLGYSSKNYYQPMELDTWNPYWCWGTLLILPYIGMGTEYVSHKGFYYGIGTVYIIPRVYFGWYF